ncbi:uncharacterized protein M6B38_304575 [Iris pallida]|uniref:LysM domain-containing protein n=1 Tax=Iris pallida TaxID=29817 RepID=A0AAX6HMT6_IRIPA|nr:uncharacterized protein M6B38_304575 [Iris pallida]
MRTERGLAMNGESCSSSSYVDGLSNGNGNGYATIPTTSTPPSSSPSPLSSGYIEHRVSKMDTLAGVAIKYGVEVADIRRMNGLVTDLQMFAHKFLQIPPGRHPPSPVVGLNGSASNGEQTPPRRPHDDVLDSLQSLKPKPPHKVSPAMSTLQGYYGLTPPKTGKVIEGTEMAVYNTGRVLCMEDGLLSRESPASGPGFSRHRKSRSLVSLENGDLVAAVVEAGDGSEADKSIRRRQKVEIDTSARTPDILLKEDSGGGFSGRTCKGLALRSKIGIRTDVDAGRHNPIPVADSFMFDDFISVRKSSSTSNLVDSESSSSSIRPTSKWSDAISRPIFDGLPKPMTGRRKTALD